MISFAEFYTKEGQNNYSVPELNGVGGSNIIAVYFGENSILNTDEYNLNGSTFSFNFGNPPAQEVRVLIMYSIN